ncbi:MAG TPA: fatty acid desaturase [Vicinamibacterales bacterium]|jgi:stearoyl-CoA desaturase (delta-9 desaturase)|nr:fatty acid desaturase [Vicinamibacterales bacterium]
MTVVALKRKRYDLGAMLPFLILHASVLLVLTVPFSLGMIAWLAGSYFLRMFGVTGGYHRYFSHRAYKLNRFWQFCFAFLAQTSGQKGALWWAAHHRDHHLYSDRKEDLHSPVHEGFWWSHLGWILSDEYDHYDPKRIADLVKYPELRWLDKYHLVPTILYGAAIYYIGGYAAFVWGYLVATVVLYHGTFLINSLAHIWGTRRFATPDESRNNFWLALVTLGEGWHNNHHYFMSATRQGIRWWEVDITYYVLKMLSWIRVTRDLRPFRVLEAAEEHPA